MWSALLAPPILGEKLSKGDVLGGISIVVGVVIIALSAATTDIEYTFDDLLALYGEASFIVYIIVIGLFTLGLVGLSRLGGIWTPLCYGAVGGTLGGQQYFVKILSELLTMGDPSVWGNNLNNTHNPPIISTICFSVSSLVIMWLM